MEDNKMNMVDSKMSGKLNLTPNEGLTPTDITSVFSSLGFEKPCGTGNEGILEKFVQVNDTGITVRRVLIVSGNIYGAFVAVEDNNIEKAQRTGNQNVDEGQRINDFLAAQLGLYKSDLGNYFRVHDKD